MPKKQKSEDGDQKFKATLEGQHNDIRRKNILAARDRLLRDLNATQRELGQPPFVLPSLERAIELVAEPNQPTSVAYRLPAKDK